IAEQEEHGSRQIRTARYTLVMRRKLLLLLTCALLVFTAPSVAEEENLAEQSIQLVEKIADIIDRDKVDCDKMAADLTRFIAENTALMKRIDAWGKTVPEEKRKA